MIIIYTTVPSQFISSQHYIGQVHTLVYCFVRKMVGGLLKPGEHWCDLSFNTPQNVYVKNAYPEKYTPQAQTYIVV